MKKVGILGAGQLGCMLAESLFKFGAEVFFYDTQQNAPGSLRTPHFNCGEWNDEKKLKDFFSACDVVTYEFENVSVELLDSLVSQTNTPLYPSAHVLSITQNRIHEKNFLKENKLPVCHFEPIYSEQDLEKIIKNTSFPFIIKTATGGYDGKGQWKLNNQKEAEEFLRTISMPPLVKPESDKTIFPLILEELIPIFKEVSCITARNKQGDIVTLPVFENEHRDHILHQTFLPAEIPETILQKVQKISKQCAIKLNVIGLLTTEFFLTKNNDIYINEFAPRPHNSGHISRIACSISQYDLHARILLDLPLHTPILHDEFYCMQNMLGDTWIKQKNGKNLNLEAWKNSPDVIEIVLYGKEEPQEKRKMGHFITVHKSRKNAVNSAEKFRKELYEKK